MVVSLLRSCEFQHAGAQRALTAGQVYDLPDVVALRFVDRGMAALVDVLDGPASREVAVMTPPENGHARRRRR